LTEKIEKQIIVKAVAAYEGCRIEAGKSYALKILPANH